MLLKFLNPPRNLTSVSHQCIPPSPHKAMLEEELWARAQRNNEGNFFLINFALRGKGGANQLCIGAERVCTKDLYKQNPKLSFLGEDRFY